MLSSRKTSELYPIVKKASQQMKPMPYKQLVSEQRRYFHSGATQRYEHRLRALQTLRKLLVDNRENLLDAVYKDLRREQRTTDFVELEMCLQEIDYFIANLKNWMSPKFAEHTLMNILDVMYTERVPYGVSLLLGPFNYPIFLVFLPLIAMIAAGNTVIIKPSELSPTSASLFEQLFTGLFDKKFIAVVRADPKETSDLLREHFDIIMFAGSTSVGRQIMKAAAEHLTPVIMEMGGKCPALVEEDADMVVTARRIIWGKFLNCGQTCIAPDYLIMTQKTRKLLFRALIQVLHEFYGENARESPDYSRVINEKHFDRLLSLLKHTQGMILHHGGMSDRSDLYIPPMIIEVDDSEDILMASEIFGPILPIYIVEDFDEAIEFLRHRQAPINVYVFTRTDEKTERLVKEVQCGSVVQNDVIMNFAADTLPFGGFGASGMGQYRGKYGFDTFTHQKAVMKRGFFFDFLMSSRYPPITDSKHRTICWLLQRRSVPRLFLYLFKYMPWVMIGIFLHCKFGVHKSLLSGYFMTRGLSN